MRKFAGAHDGLLSLSKFTAHISHQDLFSFWSLQAAAAVATAVSSFDFFFLDGALPSLPSAAEKFFHVMDDFRTSSIGMCEPLFCLLRAS